MTNKNWEKYQSIQLKVKCAFAIKMILCYYNHYLELLYFEDSGNVALEEIMPEPVKQFQYLGSLVTCNGSKLCQSKRGCFGEDNFWKGKRHADGQMLKI